MRRGGTHQGVRDAKLTRGTHQGVHDAQLVYAVADNALGDVRGDHRIIRPKGGPLQKLVGRLVCGQGLREYRPAALVREPVSALFGKDGAS